MPGLSSYERRSLGRFLALYLGSVFVLLAIIGWLFFEHNASMMKSALKFEMLSEAHRIESRLTHLLMSHRQRGESNATLPQLLASLGGGKFKVGFFDAQHRPIYSEFETMPGFDRPFYLGVQGCYSMIACPLKEQGVAYIGVKEPDLQEMISRLRWRILGYLALSFLFMAAVGYLLARLFMRPIREKIEALDRFIEETTHELNTPVSAILMTIRQLKGVEEKKLRRLRASAQRLSTMYHSLAYGLEREMEAKPRIATDLAQALRERCEAMEALIESRRLELRLRVEPCTIRINREDLQRVLDNLLSNAVKYSDPGGKIWAMLQECRLEIRDEGIGIDPDEIEEIFRRYRRANRERGGFGIGLSIVEQICREYGIGYEVVSQKGEGTAFILDFSALAIEKEV